MKKEKKSILVIIIVLLIIFFPITILSIYLKFTTSSSKTVEEPKINNTTFEENPKYSNGNLYFYNTNKEQIGYYTCQVSPCSYANSFIDDQGYALEYLNNKSVDINIINNQFVFINDDNIIKLYDIKNNKVLEEYINVKNYNNMMLEGTFIVQNKTNKWGVISIIDQTINTIISFDYDFIGLIDNIDDNNLLNSDNFVVKKDSIWYIIDKENDLISNPLSNEISSYNDVLISVKANNIYYLYDYYGQRKLNDNGFNYISFTDKYINIVDTSNNLYIYDYINDRKISRDIKLNKTDYKNAFNSVLNKEKNTIDITVDNNTYSFAI